jgi:hypothetical protein
MPAVHLNIWTGVFMWKKFGIDIRYYKNNSSAKLQTIIAKSARG